MRPRYSLQPELLPGLDKRDDNRKERDKGGKRSLPPLIGERFHMTDCPFLSALRPELVLATVSVEIRIGFLQETRSLRYQMRSEHLEAGVRVVIEEDGIYDEWHVGMAPLDLVAAIVRHVGLDPDPFP